MADVTGSLPANEPSEPTEPDAEGIAGSVTGEWVQVYQPDGEPEPALPPDPVSSRSGVVVVVVLFVVALALTIIGMVTPLFQESLPVISTYTGVNNTLSADAWQFTTTFPAATGQGGTVTLPMPVPLGPPLAVAAVLLVVAIGLWLRAVSLRRGNGVARVAGLASATFLAGFVVALGMFEWAWVHLGPSGAAGSGAGEVDTTVGVGYWTLIIAAVVAVVAAVSAYRVRTVRPPVPAPEARAWPSEPVDPGPELPVVAVIPMDEGTNW